jgi:molecular chaperone GrpE (heat shock protein)
MTKDKLEEVTTDEDDVTIEEVSSDVFAKELEELLAAADRLERALDEAGLDSKSVTGEPVEEGQKSASTFGRQIAALAEEGVSERVREYLQALATVVRISKPGEWGALAAILARIAPKAIKERADQIAEKMAKEGGSVYGYPYPAPPTNGEEKSLADVVSRLEGLEGQVKELAESVTMLKEQVRQAQESAQKALEISPRPSVTPIGREVTPVSILAQKMIGG